MPRLLDSISFGNLRSLKETGDVELRPLTLLVGKNSSGKSTFLQAFPLLKQSIERDTAGPILWYGPYVDFGSFGVAVRNESDPKEVKIGFRLQVRGRSNYYRRRFPESSDVEVNIALSGEQNDLTRAKSCKVRGWGHEILVEYDGEEVSTFQVNGTDVLTWGKYEVADYGEFLPIPAYTGPNSSEDNQKAIPDRIMRSLRYGSRRLYASSNPFLIREIKRTLDPIFHGSVTQENRYKKALKIGFGSNERMQRIIADFYDSNYWNSRIPRLKIGSDAFKTISDANIALNTPNVFEHIDRLLTGLMSNVSYVAPMRAAAKRYYRRQDLSVSEVDPRGSNLAMFLRSLSRTEKRNFQNWTYDHFGFKVYARLKGGHVSMTMEGGDGEEHNVADMGFGFSQIVPILAQLWDRVNHRSNKKRRGRKRGYARRSFPSDQLIFAIEQPELHLHPAYQALVADLFVNVIEAAKSMDVAISMIVETHSRTIINRIGNRIAQRSESSDKNEQTRFEPSDAHILMFERESSVLSTVRSAHFEHSGSLDSDWPYGFFDPDLI